MTLQNALRLIYSNLFLIIICTIIIFSSLFIYYKFVKKSTVNFNHLLSKTILFAYLVSLIGVTLTGRPIMNEKNLILFNSYVDAWNQASLSAILFLVLNIIMTIPLGFLLPLVFKKLKKFKFFLVSSSLIVLCIEISQKILSRGIFDIDDIFNNILGALIGYGLFRLYDSYYNREQNIKKSTIFLSPLIVTMVATILIIIGYQLNPYGNLSFDLKKYNMENVSFVNNTHWTSDIEEIYFNNNKFNMNEVPIFINTNKPLDGIIEFHKITRDEYIDVSIKINKMLYSNALEFDPSIPFSFEYTDTGWSLSPHMNHTKPTLDHSKYKALEDLKYYGVKLNTTATFNDTQSTSDHSIWTFQDIINEENYKSSKTSITYNDKGHIVRIDFDEFNGTIYEELTLINPLSIIEQIEEGYLPSWISSVEENPSQITLEDLQLDFLMDSKGYIQPVYKAILNIDGNEFTQHYKGID